MNRYIVKAHDLGCDKPVYLKSMMGEENLVMSLNRREALTFESDKDGAKLVAQAFAFGINDSYVNIEASIKKVK